MNTRFDRKTSVSLVTALLLSVGTMAFADNSTSGSGSSSGVTQGTGSRHKGRHHWKEMKEVREACAQANGITLPTKGSGVQLSSADRTTLRACVTEFRQNVQTCLQNAGVSKPQPGQQPSAADKAAISGCRTQALSEITGSSSATQSSN